MFGVLLYEWCGVVWHVMVWCAGVTISKERGHVIKYKTQAKRTSIQDVDTPVWTKILARDKLGGNLNQSY